MTKKAIIILPNDKEYILNIEKPATDNEVALLGIITEMQGIVNELLDINKNLKDHYIKYIAEMATPSNG